MYIYIYIYVCVCVCMYIYLFICIGLTLTYRGKPPTLNPNWVLPFCPTGYDKENHLRA